MSHCGRHPRNHHRRSRRDHRRGHRYRAVRGHPGEVVRRRPGHRLAVDGRDRRADRGQVRREDPRRGPRRPAHRRRRRRLHPEARGREPRGRRGDPGTDVGEQVTKPSTANGGFPSVVVTAVAATTSISGDIESTWKGLLAGESGIHVLEDEFVTKWDLPVRIGGHLKDPVDDHMGRLDMRRMSHVQRMAKLLGGQIWEAAGTPEVDPDRFAVVVGTGLGGGEKIVETYDLMNEGGPRKVSPLAVQMIMPNGAAAVIGLQLGARAGVMTPVSACSSGSEAIGHAWRQIVMGDADFAVCGGVEGGIEALPIAAFSMMRAMSTRNDDPEGASRPFDKDRDGFVFGEAGALMVIETEEHAKARGAKPLARLMGAGITSDAFHMVAPAADGLRAGHAMRS